MTPRCLECGKDYPREPALEVECPECGVGAGVRCRVVRPSGHVHGARFGGLPPWGHDERDLAAVEAGAYGECPEGGCGLEARADRLGVDLTTMVEIRRREIRRARVGPGSEPDVRQGRLGLDA